MKRALTTIQSTSNVKIHLFSLYMYIFFHAMLYTKLTFPWCGSVPLIYRQKNYMVILRFNLKSHHHVYIYMFFCFHGVKLIEC
jgi:hypothetical protein